MNKDEINLKELNDWIKDIKTLPAWVKLDSGVNSTKISKLYEENRQHDNLPNNLSAEGQKTIAKYFVSLVEKEKLI